MPTPTRTSTANASTSSANQPCSPSHGSVESRSTIPIIAITIVGNSTRKPQKMNACISPGTRRWNSLRWPSTTTASWRRRAGTSPARSIPDGLPMRTSRTSSSARRANRPPARPSAAARASALSSNYASLARRSSAVIAGTISLKSPTTA